MADCVLVDVPCSGLGVRCRRAEARWKKNKLDLKTFPPLQRDILRNAAVMSNLAAGWSIVPAL